VPADFSIGRVRHGATPKPRKRPAPAPRIGSPLGPIGRADAPITRAQAQAHEATERAQQALPKRPTPAIPRVAHPTRAQGVAANELRVRAATKGGPGYAEELVQDPRHRGYVKTLQHYARADQRRVEREVGRRAVREGEAQALGNQSGTIPAFDTTATLGQSGTIPVFDSRSPAARERELGAGILAAAPAAIKAKEGRGDTQLSVLGLNPNLSAIRRTLMDATSLGTLSAESQFTLNALRDAVNLPANIVGSAVEFGKAAATGDYRAAGEMIVQPYVDVIKHPEQSIREHPLGTFLLAAGVKGGVGRAAGRAARAGAFGKAARRGASRDLATRVLPGTNLAIPRRGSADLFTLWRQKAVDEKRATVTDDLRRQADDQEAKAADEALRPVERAAAAERAQTLRSRANRVDPARLSDRQIRRLVAEQFAGNEGARKAHLQRTVAVIDKALGKRSGPEVSLIAQGITHADAGDLARYADELDGAAVDLHGEALQANQALVRSIREAVKGGPDMQAALKAALVYRSVTKPLEDELVASKVLSRDQVDRSVLTPHAVREMGATFDPAHYEDAAGNRLSDAEVKELRDTYGDAALRGTEGEPALMQKVGDRWIDPEGQVLSRGDIIEDMRATGKMDPAYVTQAPMREGAKNWFMNFWKPPKVVERNTRTGEATLKGTFDAHPERLREGAARLSSLTSWVRGFRSMVDNFIVRDESGVPHTRDTYKDIEALRVQLQRETGRELQPVRLNPFGGKHDQLRQLLEDVTPDSGPDMTPMVNLLGEALDPDKLDKTAAGPWGLMPAVAAREASDMVKVLDPTTFGRSFQLAMGLFRKTVLVTNPRWYYGNAFEAALRSTVMRAGPRSYWTMRKIRQNILESGGQDALDMFDARVIGIGQFGLAGRAPKRTMQGFVEDPRTPASMRAVAKLIDSAHRTRGVKQVVDGAAAVAAFLLHVNQSIEHLFRSTMAGHAVREHLLDGRVVKLTKDAYQDAADGLMNTPAQVRLGRYVDDAYGRYDKLSPNGRRMVSMATPFIMWTLSSLNFLTRVLPRDHPVLTSLLVAINQSQEEWRKGMGLDMFSAGRLPGFLQGSIPTEGGGHIRASRYTPFSLAGDPLGTLSDSVLPLIRPVLEAMDGRDWKGNEVRGPNGEPLDQLEKLWLATKTFGQSTIPTLAPLTRTFGDPAGAGHGVAHEVNPFPAIPPKEGATSGPLGGLQKKYGIDTSGQQSLKDLQKKYGIEDKDTSLEDLKKKYGIGG
jgi:hypothetical protein